VDGSGGGAAAACRAIVDAYFRRRYAILFYSLLFTVAAAPILEACGFSADLLELFLASSLLAAVLPVGSPTGRWSLVVVLAVGVLLRLEAIRLGLPALWSASLAIWTVVALLAVALALRFALRASAIVSEHLYAALSAYLLAGNFFGVCYWLLEETWPGSLAYQAGGADQGLSLAGAIYFSFVTLATLGYGDVVPRSLPARGLAIVEAVAGQLYLAVMVARLVSLYVRGAPGGHGRGQGRSTFG
jgi:hypothetical protein